MVTANFGHLLKSSIGLDVASIGSSGLERAVQERQSACQLEDRGAYWEHVCADGTELQALIEAVVVPETWFFRDGEAFTALAGMGHEEWQRDSATRVLRLMSLPSSTGEEPYSMAMALLDAGVPPDRFRIDAVDVSGRAIACADRAVYGKNSFRGHELSFRDRHFDATPDGYRLKDAVRRQVHLQRANLLAADFCPGLGIYDVVFCRNVLIYFDRPTQDRAVAVLQRLLAPKGMLFVAPSETGLLLNHDFVSAKMALAFAFRKPGLAPPASKPRADRGATRPSTRRLATVPVPPVRATRAAPPAPVFEPAPPASGERQSGLDRAMRLADQGRFAEAASCCDEHLRLHGPSAQVFHLMALVRDASGNQSAASDYYRKALYLDPDHHEALVHFALLVEKQGNAPRAQALRNRARRVEMTVGT